MRRALSVLALATIVVAPHAQAGPVTQDPCPGTVTVTPWKQLGNDVLENLLFADGALWISDGTASAVRRFAPDGSEGTGLTGIRSPGGLAVGPDGLIYSGWGNAAADAVQRSGAGKIVRFSAGAPNVTLETYSSGFNMPNGIVFDGDGNLYASNDFDAELKVIPRDAPGDWAVANDVWGTNGLVIDSSGTTLYAAITFDQRSPIEAISLDDMAVHSTAVQLTAGVASVQPTVYDDPDTSRPLAGVKGLDDMTGDDAGYLYPVANGTGELLRVNPVTGEACLIAGGLQNPSSVRIAPEGSGFADGNPATIDFYVTEFSGAIRLITYAG